MDSAITIENDFENNLAVIQFLEKNSEGKNYNSGDIITLLENYLRKSDIPTSVLYANLENILKTDITGTLTRIDGTAIDIVSLDDFKNYLTNSNKYSEKELEQTIGQGSSRSRQTPQRQVSRSVPDRETRRPLPWWVDDG